MNTGLYSLTRVFCIALVITALRILYLTINHRDLDVEESQYWTWSQQLSFGYHSKPPLISWAIHFSTWLFGNSEWAIRLFSPITYLFSAVFVYKISKTLFNEEIGFWAALTLVLLPGVAYSATIISTDPLLILFWSMALYYFVRALQTQKTSNWAFCGLAIGLGLLSKFTMLVFFISAILYLLISRPQRSFWRKIGPYLMVVTATLVFAPNLIWNFYHKNAAFNHVIEHNINLHGFSIHTKNLSIFLISQLGILGPILIIFFIIALSQYPKLVQKEENKLLLCFSLPMLILVIAEALLSRANGNWAAIAYPSTLIFIIAFLYQNYHLLWLKLTNAFHILIIFILCGWELTVAYGLNQWPTSSSPNWQDFGMLLNQQHQAYPHSEFLVDSRELWSKSIYYGKVTKDDLFVWDPYHKVSWADNPANMDIPIGKDFLLITHSAPLKTEMIHSFHQFQQLAEINVNQRLRGHLDKIYIYRLQGFTGY